MASTKIIRCGVVLSGFVDSHDLVMIVEDGGGGHHGRSYGGGALIIVGEFEQNGSVTNMRASHGSTKKNFVLSSLGILSVSYEFFAVRDFIAQNHLRGEVPINDACAYHC
ncbi:hypothetical protein VNO78_34327 [Psophocarpus tetragonolobus]|uniref:Uncharacterized protein n=1 Tax=Psophocarpus tetragonolobus TaxID=3891 RepID=A0AAN9RKD9_PSOTE